MSKVIIIYSTTDGHTKRICSRIEREVKDAGDDVSVVSMDDIGSVDVSSFDKIVIGASIRYGKHNEEVYDFIADNQSLLGARPNAFFSVNLVARKPEKRQPDTNPYLKKFLKQIEWQPKKLAVFAGKLDYPRYSFLDRNIIRFIMWMTKGPTDPAATIEFTDWKQVESFGRVINEM